MMAMFSRSCTSSVAKLGVETLFAHFRLTSAAHLGVCADSIPYRSFLFLFNPFFSLFKAVGSSAAGGGTTLQRHITIYVLVAGIGIAYYTVVSYKLDMIIIFFTFPAGGLFLVMTILLLCKYCKRSRSFR